VKGGWRRDAARLTPSAPSGHLPHQGEGPGVSFPPLALMRLRQAMSRHCGVERTEAGLSELAALIDAMRREHGEADALIAARFIVTGALNRRESRGGHFRSDCPQSSDEARHCELRLDDLAANLSPAMALAGPAE
jgi:L-aspartate oxidase